MTHISTPFLQTDSVAGLTDRALQAEHTLNTHLSTMAKSDKYFRLVSSIIKIIKAFNPQTRLIGLYKELVTVRRIIRWEGKYDNFLQLRQGNDTLGMKAFKVEQIMGDIVDQSAFWLSMLPKPGPKHKNLLQTLQQIECNCYFFQCITWLLISLYRLTYLSRKQRKGVLSTPEAKKLFESKFKAVKYLMDMLTSYNNSSLGKSFGKIDMRIAGILTFLSSCISIYLLWA